MTDMEWVKFVLRFPEAKQKLIIGMLRDLMRLGIGEGLAKNYIVGFLENEELR